ncbi:hypothetical protein Ancab_006065 [Ancistrocladus abbreviatus]
MMGGIVDCLASEIVGLQLQLCHHKDKCQSAWVEIHKFLDMKDLQKPFHLSSSSSSPSSLPSPHPLSIGAETWQIAECKILEILSVIQPTPVSECRRKEIIKYIQALIEDSFGIKVLPFGSVPLKTYLPDGDIDLTALSHHDVEQDLMTKFCCLLEYEAQYNTKMQVRDVQSIPAQVWSSNNADSDEVWCSSHFLLQYTSPLVKVVKCTVGSVSIDISFNQTAGLSALSFLEQVDQFVGKDHLFKQSVILIKAWCFYESRTLGAHHGLIATYALETMVLHIINLYHSSLHSPLAVLYKFLVYYGTFDWKQYCVSINGLVLLSSLPEIVVKPTDDSDELLLTDEFMRNFREEFSFSTPMLQAERHVFPVKFLNILDPLRENNNLGRSISKGNFNRIKCALAFGTKQLQNLLVLAPDSMSKGLEKMFRTTLQRNGMGTRPDVLVPVPVYGAARSQFSSNNADNGDVLLGVQCGVWFNDNRVPPVQPNASPPFGNWKNTCSVIDQNLQHVQDPVSQGNNRSMSMVSRPDAVQTTNAAAVPEKPASRGTGTYIPRLEHVLQMEKESRHIWQEWELRVSKRLADGNAFSVIDTISMPLKMESEGGSGLKISLEEFPYLVGKPVQMKNIAKVWQPKEISTSMDNIEFGTLKPSSLEGILPSLPCEQPDPGLSTVSNPSAATEESHNSPKIEEEMTVQPPCLGDVNEFPPLGSIVQSGKRAQERR